MLQAMRPRGSLPAVMRIEKRSLEVMQLGKRRAGVAVD